MDGRQNVVLTSLDGDEVGLLKLLASHGIGAILSDVFGNETTLIYVT